MMVAQETAALASSSTGKRLMRCWVRCAGRLIPTTNDRLHGGGCSAAPYSRILAGIKAPDSTQTFIGKSHLNGRYRLHESQSDHSGRRRRDAPRYAHTKA